MAIDKLQSRIRKSKCPLMVDLSVLPEHIPQHLLASGRELTEAVGEYLPELLNALKGSVPAVRFSFTAFALMGHDGLGLLSDLLRKSVAMGFYTALDIPEMASAAMAGYVAEKIWGEGSAFPCDALVISAYPGSDVIKPFIPVCADQKKDLFVTVRTSNKSASELQDLLTGSRLVHEAAADYVNRFSAEQAGKSGFSRVAIAASATSAESLRNLRMKYPKLFILVDGLDVSGANAKNCAAAFDKLGHGAIVCAGSAVAAAWQKAGNDGSQYAADAQAAAERYVKNLSRYATIL